MVVPLAVGVPAWPEIEGGWDPWAILTVAIAVVFIPRALHTRLSVTVLVACVVTGALLAAAIDAWGVPLAVALALGAGLALRWVGGRREPPARV